MMITNGIKSRMKKTGKQQKSTKYPKNEEIEMSTISQGDRNEEEEGGEGDEVQDR